MVFHPKVGLRQRKLAAVKCGFIEKTVKQSGERERAGLSAGGQTGETLGEAGRDQWTI